MNDLYTESEIEEAYLAWVNIPHELTTLRLMAWDFYVDARDGLPAGTTSNRRQAQRTGDDRVNWMDFDA